MCAHCDALRERIEALATEWERDAAHQKERAARVSGDREQPYLVNAAFYETHARRVRAALAADPPPSEERTCITPGCTNKVPEPLNWCDDHDSYHDNPPLPSPSEDRSEPDPVTTRDALRVRIVEVLEEHDGISYDLTTPRQYTQHGGWTMQCTCGRPIGDQGDEDAAYADHRAHLADALLGLWDEEAGVGSTARERAMAEQLGATRAVIAAPSCLCGHGEHLHDRESVPDLCMVCGGSARCRDSSAVAESLA